MRWEGRRQTWGGEERDVDPAGAWPTEISCVLPSERSNASRSPAHAHKLRATYTKAVKVSCAQPLLYRTT